MSTKTHFSLSAAFVVVAGAVAAGLCAGALPVSAPDVVAGCAAFGAGGAATLAAASHLIAWGGRNDGVGRIATGTVALLGGFFLSAVALVGANKAFDMPLKNTLADASTEKYGADWRNAQKGDRLDVNVRLGASTSVPVKTTIIGVSSRLSGTGRDGSGPAILNTCTHFNVESVNGKPPSPDAQTLDVCNGRHLKDDELKNLLPLQHKP